MSHDPDIAVRLAEEAGRAEGFEQGVITGLKEAQRAIRRVRQEDPSTYNVWSRVQGAIEDEIADREIP
jgi:hypothetical protein